jgi:heme A synthase
VTRLLFIQAKNRGYFRLTLLTSLLAFAWILLGVYIQTTGSALACPDWPQCFGFFTAPHTQLQMQLATERFPHTAINQHHIWLEVIYRYLSVAVLGGIILLTITAAKLWEELSAYTLFICFCLLILASGEITLRLHTVAENQQPLFLLAHALIAFATVSLLWWLNRITNPNSSMAQQSYSGLKPWAWLSLLLVIQVVLSLAVNISYVSSACSHLAFCANALTSLVQNLHHNTPLHWLFSQKTLDLLAFASLGYICLFSSLQTTNRQINHLAFFMLFLIAADIVLVKLSTTGMSPTTTILCQTTIATFLLMSMISLMIHVYRTPHHYWSH